jgi:hypothetical protein
MLLCGSANISHKHPTFRLGLNYKFVGTDRSVSQIRNPGVTPGFFVERTDDADVLSASGGLMSKIAQFFH